jgi:ABC-type transporter Mla subunit MlaD
LHISSDAESIPKVPQLVIMSVMADKSGRPRPERQRLKTLAQAALNADVTVGQLEAVLAELGTSLSGVNNSLGAFESTLEHLNDTLGTLDALAPRLTSVVDRMEATVGRVERIVDLVETAVSPWSATENAVRGVVNAVKDRTRR